MSPSLQHYWQQRQPREKYLALLAAIIALLALLWLSLQAARHNQQQAQRQAERAQQQLASLQQQVPDAERLLTLHRQRHSPHWQDDALALAREKGLELDVFRRDDTQLRFSPAVAEFPRLAEWLGQLELERNVRATRLLLKNDASGLALVELELQHDE